jgi:hypothetical protein
MVETWNGKQFVFIEQAEGLLAEQNMIIYYNFIEQLCDCISSNLSLMNKQKYALLFNMLLTTYFLLFMNSFFFLHHLSHILYYMQPIN